MEEKSGDCEMEAWDGAVCTCGKPSASQIVGDYTRTLQSRLSSLLISELDLFDRSVQDVLEPGASNDCVEVGSSSPPSTDLDPPPDEAEKYKLLLEVYKAVFGLLTRSQEKDRSND